MEYVEGKEPGARRAKSKAVRAKPQVLLSLPFALCLLFALCPLRVPFVMLRSIPELTR